MAPPISPNSSTSPDLRHICTIHHNANTCLNSETHIYNPTWPPHARYHNGQTMTLGLFTGLITFYVLLVHLPRSSTAVSAQNQITHLTWVTVLQSMMYLSSLSGILYPGALWMDPEFGDGKPQLYVFPWIVGVLWVGWAVERRSLGKKKTK